MNETAPAVDTRHFLSNWLGHRKLTRRVLDAFPEEELFGFSVGGMRPAADLAHELLQVGSNMVRGVATGDFGDYETANPHKDKASLLAAWDADIAAIEAQFPQLTEEQLAAEHTTFGMFTASGLVQLQYTLDNEIHHRGQMYVYLRALGIEPPAFYDR